MTMRIASCSCGQLQAKVKRSVMLVALATSPPTFASDVPPAGALEVIARVSRAATQLDYVALRGDMIQEFIWSFGGDSSAEQAIAEWKKQPRYLRELAKITRAKCAYRKDDKSVECPANAGTAYRAGFKLSAGRWKMAYFVGGD